MKFIYLLVVLVFMGCSQVEPKVEKMTEAPKKVEVSEVKKAVEVKKEVMKKEEVLEEPKVTKRVGADIPSSCYMWSDGCNVCTKTGDGTKASCTTNPECTNKMFSCLQWY
jgi:hypothetical protein